MTDCLNGTIVTYNGNEFALQNDFGNYKFKISPKSFFQVNTLGMKKLYDTALSKSNIKVFIVLQRVISTKN